MEQVSHRPSVEYVPAPPPATRHKGATTFTQIGAGGGGGADAAHGSSMHSLVLDSPPTSATVFVATTRPQRDAAAAGAHVVTIRVNTDPDGYRPPKISSVHLKSDVHADASKSENDVYKKNSSLVRITVDEPPADGDRTPYINCNSYSLTSMNAVMSSGQCSPSDTLDSGTCSDLDGTPPPLPKKKITKTNARKKAVTVTMIGGVGTCGHNELDFEDNDSNISCDSLNSSELNGSVHNDENQDDVTKFKKNNMNEESSSFNKKDGFLPCGLLQDIRDRTTKLNCVEIENKMVTIQLDKNDCKINDKLDANENVVDAKKGKDSKIKIRPSVVNITRTPIVIETTYEERKARDESKTNKRCYSGDYFDTDKFYDFHLNEKQFDVEELKSRDVKGADQIDSVDYFAGIKNYKSEEAPSTIKSSKGTIRGVKNRVRAGIATFLQINDTAKSYREKDAGKVVIYSTTMGIVRSTYQRCMLVKKILRNLLVKYEDRDVFMSTEYQDEIRDRMKSDKILVPQLFVDGQHIGDAETVEKLNESGELRKMLKPYKSPDACTTCQVCGGFRLLPCRICNGSKKSLHRNHFTAEFVALKCMNCDEVGLVRCEACS